MNNLRRNIDREGSRKTQLAVVTGLTAFSVIFSKAVFLYSALALGLMFLFVPWAGDRFVSLWVAAGERAGWINARIVLSFVYFAILLPISLVARFFREDPLFLKDPGTSVYVVRNHTYTAEDLENIS